MKSSKKIISAIISVFMACRLMLIMTACGNSAEESFEKKPIYSDSLYKTGIVLSEQNGKIEIKNDTNSNESSIVLKVNYGKIYEFYFPQDLNRLEMAYTYSDPCKISAGSSESANIIKCTNDDFKALIYIPRKSVEYIVINTGGEKTPITINEQLVLAQKDSSGEWYKPGKTGDFLGEEGSFADYQWSSDEIFENLYEPLREQYPNYISREHIGKDQSNKYDMYVYIFEPKNYTQTVFLTAGMHANEEDAYFALARFMQEVANENGKNKQLHFLRTKVRFIVIPIINVWGTYEGHSVYDSNWALRYNSENVDLNRDFVDLSQQETKNVKAVLDKYGDDITFGIDYHTTPDNNNSDLFFSFPVVAENASVNYKTTNHIYHRLVSEKLITAKRKLNVPSDGGGYGSLAAINGKYSSSKTLDTFLWNNYDIPSMTIEYMNFTSGVKVFQGETIKGSAKGLQIAVEILGNFVIQNVLYFD